MIKKKILIIDDEKGFTDMLKINLELTQKYEVIVENTSTNALNTAIDCNPDLILLDIIMPGIQGSDLGFLFKEHGKLNQTPVVFLTATVTKDEVDIQGGKINGYPFIAKPSNLLEILKVIAENIRQY